MSWRRILLLTAACLVFLLAGTWVVLQESGATRAFVRSMLGRLLATKWALQDAVVDLGQGTVTLTGLSIDDPQARGTRLLQVDQLRLGIDTNPLGDPLSVQTVEVEGLDLRIDLRTGRMPALADLLRDPDAEARAPRDRLPPIRVRRSRVELQVGSEVPPLVLADVELDLLPERDAPARAHLNGTARCPELGLDFAVDGMADLARTEFQATARLPVMRVDDALLQRLRTYLPALPATGVTGSLQQMVLWFEMHGERTDDGTAPGTAAGIVVQARNVACRLPEIPYPIDDAAMEFAASTLEGGSVRIAARQDGPGGNLDVHAELVHLWSDPVFAVRGKGRAVRVDAFAASALNSFAVGRDIMLAIEPTAGQVDLDLFLQRRQGGKEELELDVGVSSAEMTYHGFGDPRIGFPLPLRAVHGSVHVREHRIAIEDARGEIRADAGGGEVHCSGVVVEEASGHSRVAVDVDAPRVQFGPQVRAALNTLLRDISVYDDFAPTGTAAVSVRIRPSDEGGWQVRLSPQEAGMTWRGLPVPIEAMAGQIQVRSDGVLFDVRARRGPGSLKARGRLVFPLDGPDPGDLELWVAAADLPLDGQLRQGVGVLAPDLETIWSELRPEGRCSAEFTVWRAAGEPDLGYDGRLSLHDSTLLPQVLVLPLHEVNGSVFVHGRGKEQRLDLDAVHAAIPNADGSGKAILAAVGSLRRIAGSNQNGDLTAVVRDLPLDDRLADSLDRLAALSRRTWNVLRPSGTVDLVFHRQRAEAGTPVRQDLTVQLRGVGSDAEMLPQPAREVTGQLRITDGRVDFTDLRARMGTALVVCDQGHVAAAAADPTRTEVVFEVNSDRFPVDDNLARLFEGPMRQAILDRQLHGSARIARLQLTFLVPPESSGLPFETTVSGSFQPFDVSLVMGARVEGVEGLVQLFESRVDRTGGWLSGTIENGAFRVFGQPCEGVTGGFHADPERVVFDPLALRLHGGRIAGNDAAPPILYTLPAVAGEDGSLAANLEFDGLDLNELLVHGGMVKPLYSGTLRGHVRLDELRGADFVDMRGEGRFQLVEGNLGIVPVFSNIYALLNEADRPRFESGTCRFRVGDRRIELQQLTLGSPLFQIAGTGTMSMDGYVDVKLTLDTLFGGSANVLVLPFMLQAIASRLVRFHLFGPMRDLHAEQRWITERDPRRLPLVPAPPRLDKPRRPDY